MAFLSCSSLAEPPCVRPDHGQRPAKIPSSIIAEGHILQKREDYGAREDNARHNASFLKSSNLRRHELYSIRLRKVRRCRTLPFALISHLAFSLNDAERLFCWLLFMRFPRHLPRRRVRRNPVSQRPKVRDRVPAVVATASSLPRASLVACPAAAGTGVRAHLQGHSHRTTRARFGLAT